MKFDRGAIMQKVVSSKNNRGIQMSLKKVGIRFFPRGPIILSETQKRSSCTAEKWSNYCYNPEMSYIAKKGDGASTST